MGSESTSLHECHEFRDLKKIREIKVTRKLNVAKLT